MILLNMMVIMILLCEYDKIRAPYPPGNPKVFRKYWCKIVRTKNRSFGEIQLTMLEKYSKRKGTWIFVMMVLMRMMAVFSDEK